MRRTHIILFLSLSLSSCSMIDNQEKYEWQKANCGEDLGKLQVGMSEKRMLDCSHPTGYTPYKKDEWVSGDTRFKMYRGGGYDIDVANGLVTGWSKTRLSSY